METGAVHDTTDVPVAFVDVSSVAETPVGARARPIGVTELDATDTTDVPAEFVAVTVNTYDVPFVRPVTVQLVAGGSHTVLVPWIPGITTYVSCLEAPDVPQESPPGVDVTV